MAESENKRTRRTPQERAAEVDEKIAKIDQSIKELESKKDSVVAETASNLWRPRSRKFWLPSRPANLGRRKSRRSRKSLSWQ